ncbi:MAG: ATP-binding protein [Thiotrichales bacterium]|nr:ATP-binding protein [Thiotrichales bacterium]
MMRKRWFPLQHKLPDGSTLGRLIHAGTDWQIFRLKGDGRMLVARSALADRWVASQLIPDTVLQPFVSDHDTFKAFASSPDQRLEPVIEGGAPDSKADGVAFALSLSETRKVDATTPLHDAIYAERFSRLLPTWTVSERATDEEVLGLWLTGGVAIPATSSRRLTALVAWLDEQDVREVVGVAGLSATASPAPRESSRSGDDRRSTSTGLQKPTADGRSKEAPPSDQPTRSFRLAGRQLLEAFFREHVIDIVENSQRYKALGIEFPPSVVLHGPPGCGKTFAIERLTEYLDWPLFLINSNSVGSPYIHETARKVGAVFDKAIDAAPSIVVIEEMESYLSDRQLHESTGLHHVEEVGEFLRRIPEAHQRQVLIMGTTNRLEMIDAAILRRGRFDHLVEVGLPTDDEVSELLKASMRKVPTEGEIDTREVVKALTGRALSDTAFVVREAARLAARAGKDALDGESLRTALAALPALEPERRPIGFIHC